MTSFRENPIRRQPSRRPTWLLPVAIVGGVLVAVVLVIVVVRFLGGSGDEEPAADVAPTAAFAPPVLPAEAGEELRSAAPAIASRLSAPPTRARSAPTQALLETFRN